MINMLFAGFGGQGILFVGKITANAGMIYDKQVSWLPSYGPEMRGGTANCSVCIDDEPISCPLVLEPDILVAMNKPSYNKFENSIVSGGTLVYDSSLIEKNNQREDINIYSIPATSIADSENLKGLANIIMLGYTLQKTNFLPLDIVKNAIQKSIPKSKEHLLNPNLKALEIGFNYK